MASSRSRTRQDHRITDMDALERLYGKPSGPALAKEIDHISAPYRAFIEKAPFLVLATVGPEGLDCSPRGDPAGFVRVQDEKTVLIPDRPGNNRVDALRNIVRDPRISLLFLIPGVGETLRINGRAEILVEPARLASFAIRGKRPKSVLKVHAEQVYVQCPKALVRARLWDPEARIPRSTLPSLGEMIAAASRERFDSDAFDRDYPDRVSKTIY